MEFSNLITYTSTCLYIEEVPCGKTYDGMMTDDTTYCISLAELSVPAEPTGFLSQVHHVDHVPGLTEYEEMGTTTPSSSANVTTPQ